MALRSRLNDTRGFTIGEVLLAVALVGLLTMAVAAGIGVAVNAYGDIRMHSEGQAVLNNAVTAVTDELRFACDVEQMQADGSTYPDPGIDDGGPAYVFNSAARGYRLYLANGLADDGGSQRIMLYAATALPSESGGYESYGIVQSSTPLPLVSTESDSESIAESNAFTARLTSLSWDEASRTWRFSLEVTDGTYTTSTGDAPIVVRSVNTW